MTLPLWLFTVAGGIYVNSSIIAKKNGLSGLHAPPYEREPRRRVSVIVPAYKEEKYIGLLLRSARNQTEPVAEIVVADSSPDGATIAVASQWGARVIPAAAGNIAAARNAGAAASTGEILLFCDADVLLSNFLVERAVTALEQGYALAHPKEALYDSILWNTITWSSQIARPKWNTTRCVAVPRSVFDEVGGYDEACNPMQEGRCREDLSFGARVSDRYGYHSLKVLGPLIATSARRYKRFSTTGLQHFDVPVRASVMRVTGGRNGR